MKNLKPILAGIVALGFAFSTHAMAEEGFYIGGQGGINLVPSENYSGSGGAPNLRFSFDNGWAAGGVFGYDFGNHWSTEFEYTHRNNNLDGINVITDGGLGAALGTSPLSGALSPVQGQVSSNSWLWNVYYNFRPQKSFNPFLGAGAGLSSLKFTGIQGGAGLPAMISSQKDTTFTVQGIAGFKQRISDTVFLVVSYRFTHMNGADMTLAGSLPVSGPVNNHTFMAGIILKFGGPKAAPPPPPPSAPVAALPPPPPPPLVAPPPPTIPGPFLVFFDWDSSVLDREALAILGAAVAAYREFGIARIVADGYTDLSGPEWYNLGLSDRRAEAVRAALEGMGLRANIINIAGYGEADPRVPTADGVRERQNRRVEITLVE